MEIKKVDLAIELLKKPKTINVVQYELVTNENGVVETKITPIENENFLKDILFA